MKAAAFVSRATVALAIGLVLPFAAGACGGGEQPSPQAPSSAGGGKSGTAVPGPRHPSPYTAEQIRGATRAGRTYRYRVETKDKPATERVMTFAAVDAAGADLVTDGEGKKRVTWEELRQHAEFPEALVRTREERVTVPAGTFDCLVYVVLGEDGEATTYFFAKDLPGAPVQIFVNKDGRRVTTTKLVEHRTGS